MHPAAAYTAVKYLKNHIKCHKNMIISNYIPNDKMCFSKVIPHSSSTFN